MRFIQKIKTLTKVGILLPAFFFAGLLKAQQYSIKNYSVTDGLPQSQVFGLYQDDEGYIWMGTRGGGIVRFDGKRFTPLTNETDMGFINRLAHNSTTVFIAHANGYSLYDKKKRQLSHPDNPINRAAEAVSALYPLGNDSLVVCTVKGIYIGPYGNPKKISYRYRDNDDIPNCVIRYGRNILLGSNYGVILLEPGASGYTATQLGRASGLRTPVVRSFIEYRGQLITGTYGGGLYVYNNKTFSRLELPGVDANAIVQCLFADSKNNLWMGTFDRGVWIYNPEKKQTERITEDEGLCRNNIITIIEDDWGNIWLGSSGGGISKYNGQLFVHYTNRTGLPGKNVYACLQAPDSTIWLGTSAAGITAIYRGEIVQFDAETGFTQSKVKALYYSHHHNLLFIGTEGDGLWTYNGQVFDRPTYLNEYTGKWIKQVTEDPQHNLVVSTASKGVICFTPALRHLYSLNKSNGLPANRINHCLPWDKYLWIASEGGGLVAYNTLTGTIEKPLAGNGKNISIVRCLVRDRYNRLWMATPSGVGYISPGQNNTFHAFDLPAGHNNVYLMYQQDSCIFLGTAQGLVKLVPAAKPALFRTVLYGANEGFTGIECSLNAAGPGNNKSILFGTINGLTIYQPGFEKVSNIAPRLNFVQINLFYENILAGRSTGSTHIFDYHQNHLGFKFMGIDQLNPDGVKYRWKLEGLENTWSPVTSTNEVNYTNLAPGDYTFRVKACNTNGLWTPVPLSFTFHITRPWYNENWFYILATVLFVALLVFVVLTMNLRSRRRQRQYREKVEMEVRLLGLQQMALRLQMNPHFIFNCLNSIQNLVSQNRNDDANAYIQEFSGLMRGMVDLTPKENIRLDQELSLLSSYLELEKLNRSNSFDYDITVDLEDAPDFYRIPPLLIQPFAENAIVHGFKGIEYPGKISVHVTERNHYLVVTIADNGKGPGTTLEIPEERNSAIKITTERLNLYNKKTGDWIGITPNQPSGLTVTLTLISE